MTQMNVGSNPFAPNGQPVTPNIQQSNVFQQPPVAPQVVPQVAPTVAPQVAPTSLNVEESAKPKKTRKAPNRQMTLDERKFVLQHYASMSTDEIATHLNLTKQQVYRTVNESRKGLQARIAALQEPDAPKGPETEAQLQKLQSLLDNLPNKPKFGPGHAGRTKGKSTVNTLIDDLLQDMA